MSNRLPSIVRLVAPALVAAATLSVSGAARADEPAPSESPAATAATPSPDAPQTKSSSWYGWQTLSTDGAAVLLGVLSAAADGQTGKDAFGGAAIAAYGLGGPTVHAAHGRWGAGAGSLALRVGTPVVTGFVGGLIGAALPTKNEDALGGLVENVGQTYLGLVYGVLAGAGIAAGLDAAFLAHETKTATAAEKTARPSMQVAPTFAVTREGGSGTPSGARATVGVAATF